MTDQALIRAILQRIKDGDRKIDTTPHGEDSGDDNKFHDYMHMLDDKGLINVTDKHLGGVWDIDGLTLEGENYLKQMEKS